MLATLEEKVINSIANYQQSAEGKPGAISGENQQERVEFSRTIGLADIQTKQKIEEIRNNFAALNRKDLRELSSRTSECLEVIEEILLDVEDESTSIVKLLNRLKNSLNELLSVIRETRSKQFRAKFSSFEETDILPEEKAEAIERFKNFCLQ